VFPIWSILGRLRIKPALFSCLALIVSAQDSVHLELDTLPRAIIQQRLEENPRTLATREAALIALFHDSGCEAAEEKVPGAAAPNLICVLPGETGSTIVVGGHFDFAGRGTGAVDDWSGAVLLPSLLQSLKTRPRRHRLVFVAFAGEERDLLGSRQYVKKLSPQEKREIHAMINLECLGTTSPKVWASRADKQLLESYVRAAQALGFEAAASNVDAVGDDDSHPFLDAKIPVLTIHSVTQQTLALLHSPRDTVRAIIPDEYYAAYRLAATFLALLDSTLP
jgi:hypothetical protein